MADSGSVCIEAPYIDQSGAYPTGCESVSAVMLLRFLGVDITVDEFIEDYLEKQGFEERDGEIYGPDPRKSFCGSETSAGRWVCRDGRDGDAYPGTRPALYR